MPPHRLVFYFIDAAATDKEVWQAWMTTAPQPLKVQLGERRPYIEFASPLPARSDAAETSRADEVAGLDSVQLLVRELATLARSTSRSIGLLLSGRPFGTVDATGGDAAFAANVDEWTRLLEARPPDVPVWERKGWVSIWAGTLSREECDKLLKEYYETDGPISAFARAIGIRFYDHDTIEKIQSTEAVAAGVGISRLSYAASFVDAIAVEHRDLIVTTIVALYDADFSQRPRDAARHRLKFLGSYPYVK